MKSFCYILCFWFLVQVCCAQIDPELIEKFKKNLDSAAFYIAADDSECSTDLQVYGSSLAQFEPWALYMFDATQKVQSGILDGNMYGLGHFDECLAIDAGSKFRNITGKYCLAEIPFPTEIARQGGIEKDFADKIRFKWGVCLPKSCNITNLVKISEKLLQNISVQINYQEDDCYYKGRTWDFTTADYIAIAIFGTVAFLMIISTLYEFYLMKYELEPIHPLLLSFSIVSNSRQLFKVSPKRKESRIIHSVVGIRAISMAWIIYGHGAIMDAQAPIFNFLQGLDITRTVWSQTVIGATISVDTFFVLSGLLVSYIMLGQFKDGIKFKFLPMIYIHRYLRLTPAFAAMILFQITFMKYIGWGPLWASFYAEWARPCIDFWWTSLLYIQNYVNPMDYCLGQSWYLSVDTQMFFVAPILLIIFQKWKWLTYPVLAIGTIASSITIFVLSYEKQLFAGTLHPDAAPTQEFIYVPTHTRCGPYLIGMALGYYMHNNRGKKIRLPMVTVIIGWILFFAITSAIILSNAHFIQKDYEFDKIIDPLFNATHRTVWALCLVWLILACEYGFAGPINSILAWRLWQPIGRLTYSQYLVHPLYLRAARGSERTPRFINSWFFFSQGVSDVTISTILAIFLYLSFESPLINVETLIFRRAKNAKSDVEINGDNLGTSNKTWVYSNNDIVPTSKL